MRHKNDALARLVTIYTYRETQWSREKVSHTYTLFRRVHSSKIPIHLFIFKHFSHFHRISDIFKHCQGIFVGMILWHYQFLPGRPLQNQYQYQNWWKNLLFSIKPSFFSVESNKFSFCRTIFFSNVFFVEENFLFQVSTKWNEQIIA